jgi:hypothetical protein
MQALTHYAVSFYNDWVRNGTIILARKCRRKPMFYREDNLSFNIWSLIYLAGQTVDILRREVEITVQS